ncbi:hypothetical protein KUTeg_016030 [Tegillarca granosa]|uniref:Uncharacterized protein n=1 Tax=Tegillarca granosa TaxID=220873 RepID=A0ABQ9EPI2_TEGGR|nr:hypothetical protein KUTeg_016030 [Tegillarca granosa]
MLKMRFFLFLALGLFGKVSHAQLTGVTASSHVASGDSEGSFAILPETCLRIYNDGSATPYNNTSIAAVFQIFCSIRQRLSQCIADNQQQMLQGNITMQWSTALLFDKRVFDEDSTNFCNSFPAVADDLECVKSANSDQTRNCSYILIQGIPPIFQMFRNGTITKDLAQKTICRISNTSTNCLLNTLDFATATDCLIDVPLQGQFCGKIYFANLFTTTRFDPTMITTTAALPSVDDNLRRFCPPMKLVVDCTYIPLSRCSRNLTNTMNSVVNMLMTDRCRSYADTIGLRPWDFDISASSMVKCGRVITTQIGKATVGIGGNFTVGNELETVKQAMAIACRDGNWLLKCIEDRVLASRNVYDKTLREILDFSTGVDRHKLFREVCQNITDIQSGVQCILNRGRTSSTNIISCLRNYTEIRILSNATQLSKLNGSMIRGRFCKPIQSLITCAKDTFGSCSTSLESLMENIPESILRTDCGGIRKSTTRVVTTPSNGGRTNASNQFKKGVIGFAILLVLLMNEI